MKDLISQCIEGVIAGHLSSESGQVLWKAPLIGYASAADPLFKDLKRSAHQGHLLPTDLLEGAKTVIAYFLPFAEAVLSGNASGELPSIEWAYAYNQTNEMITLINKGLELFLHGKGYRACSIPATHNFDPISLMSAWSHRHVAYIAGLGTLGLNRMLITEKGCGGRIGSIVTELELAPDERIKGDYCLYLHNGSCSVCLDRCPCSALQKDNFNRQKCYERLLENEARLHLEGHADVCGKCCCGLPCSEKNPVTKR
jgi:epoxyqueuosine reductase QueG